MKRRVILCCVLLVVYVGGPFALILSLHAENVRLRAALRQQIAEQIADKQREKAFLERMAAWQADMAQHDERRPRVASPMAVWMHRPDGSWERVPAPTPAPAWMPLADE